MATPHDHIASQRATATQRPLTAPACWPEALNALEVGVLVTESAEAGLPIVSFNTTAGTILGRPTSEMVGHPMVDFFPELERAPVRRQLQEGLAREGRAHVERALPASDGTPRWLTLTVTPLPTEPERLVVTLADRTRDHDILEQLARLISLQDSLFQTVPDLLYVLDTEGHLVRWNNDLELITGYTAKELQGRSVLELAPPEDREKLEQALRRKLKVGFGEVETHLLTKDGRKLLFHWRSAVLDNALGEPMNVIGTGRDVTERRRLEAEVKTQYQRLLELDRLKSIFVNAVSHELRTPLTSIKGYAEFLEDKLGGPLTESQQRFVEQIQENTGRLTRLVDDLLDFARLESGHFKLVCKQDALNRLVAEAVESLQPMAIAKDLHIRSPQSHPPIVTCLDARRIEQVLINLLGNAIKFTPPGGRIKVTLSRQDQTAKVEVTDTGPGIAPEHQAGLFEKFFQVSGEKQSGLGLGLFISKALVTAHGGQIGLRSTPGQGASFWFTLPVVSC